MGIVLMLLCALHVPEAGINNATLSFMIFNKLYYVLYEYNRMFDIITPGVLQAATSAAQ